MASTCYGSADSAKFLALWAKARSTHGRFRTREFDRVVGRALNVDHVVPCTGTVPVKHVDLEVTHDPVVESAQEIPMRQSADSDSNDATGPSFAVPSVVVPVSCTLSTSTPRMTAAPSV